MPLFFLIPLLNWLLLNSGAGAESLFLLAKVLGISAESEFIQELPLRAKGALKAQKSKNKTGQAFSMSSPFKRFFFF